MPSLELLDAERLKLLQIVPPPGQEEVPFRFYEIFRSPYYDEWDVLGLRRTTAALLDVRLLHVDQEMVEEGWGHEDAPEWPFFNTLEEAGGFVRVSPAELPLVIHLFESWLGDLSSQVGDTVKRFQAIGREDLLALHIRPLVPDRPRRGYFRYLPDKGIAPPDEISLLAVPIWAESNAIRFATFSQHRLRDLAFNPSDSWGIGRMTFNASALRDLINLLKRHALNYHPPSS